MASLSPLSVTSSRRRPELAGDNRFDQQLAKILLHATQVFCEKGYEGASMRDLSRVSGMSLAGMYHYFKSKEELLYLIQKHTFTTIVEQLRHRLSGITSPEERIRALIFNHLKYFLANQGAMKVLSHEDEVLKNHFGAAIRSVKREYYALCLGLLEDYKRAEKLEFSTRTAVLSLFSMMNWIYTWYNPRQDANARKLAQEMGDIFMRGIGGNKHSAKKNSRVQ